MLNAHETQLALEHFFKDCYKFWLRTTNDDRVAFEKALNDTRGIIYKGIVEYDPTGKYSGCEVYDFYQEFFESLDYEPQQW